MVEKIISGGQTGVDRAALDFALEEGFSCGGWCPKGRRAEDGVIAQHYPLDETPSSEYRERTEWNVRDSDGTLVLTHGSPTQGTALTIELAHGLGRPCLVIDLVNQPHWEALAHWVKENTIRVLNIAGPRESKFPGIYQEVMEFLCKTLILKD